MTRSGPTPRHQDTAFSWLVAFCGFLSNVIILGCSYSYGVLFPELLQEFRAGKATTAWVGTLAIALSFIFGPLAGKTVSRFGARVVTVIGAFVASLGLLGASRSPSILVLFLTYGVIFAVGSCFVYTSVFVIVPTYFARWRSLAVGLIVSGPGAGIFIMSPILGATVEAYSWRGAFILEACSVVLIAVLAGCTFRPNDQPASDIETSAFENAKEKTEASCRTSSEKPLWKNKELMVCCGCVALVNIGDLIPIVHLAAYCEEIGITLGMASRLYLAFGIGSVFGRVATGQLFDVTRLDRHYVLQGVLVVQGMSTLLLPLARTFVGLAACCSCMGLGSGVFATTITVLVLDSVPAFQRPQAYGACLFSLSLPMMSCGPLGGFMADSLGSYVPAFLFAGSVYLACCGLVCVSRCWKCPERAPICKELDPGLSHQLVVSERLTVV